MLFFRKQPEKKVDPGEGGSGIKPKSNQEFREMFLKKD